jgi:hypothetical protein
MGRPYMHILHVSTANLSFVLEARLASNEVVAQT